MFVSAVFFFLKPTQSTVGIRKYFQEWLLFPPSTIGILTNYLDEDEIDVYIIFLTSCQFGFEGSEYLLSQIMQVVCFNNIPEWWD